MQPAAHAIVHVQLGEDGDPSADGIAHGPADLAGKPCSVLQRATVAVPAAVQFGAEERTRQVVVPEMDLDGVEAGLDRGACGVGMRRDDSRQVIGACRTGELQRQRREQPARRERRQPVAATVGNRPGVTDLGRDRGTLGVHCVREAPQSGARLVAPVDLVPVGSSFR